VRANLRYLARLPPLVDLLNLLVFRGGPILMNLEPSSDLNLWSLQLDKDCDVGPRGAEKCLDWIGEKVLEHSGFEGWLLI